MFVHECYRANPLRADSGRVSNWTHQSRYFFHRLVGGEIRALEWNRIIQALRRVKPMKRQTRITTPLVRENGALRPATWDEALDRAAEGFRESIERHGPRSFGLFSCSKTTNEMNYLAQKFARVAIGSNNIDSCNRT